MLPLSSPHSLLFLVPTLTPATHTTMRVFATAALAALPLAAAFRIPTAQDAFAAAQELLEDMTPASDITLASVPADDHYVITSALHPVRRVRSGHLTDFFFFRTTRSVSRALTAGVTPTSVRSLGKSTSAPPGSKRRVAPLTPYRSYLDVGGGKDLWFSFFESRGNPSKDPVIMWINGGPGCSSALGLLMELGPCSVADDPKTVNDTKPNKHSWNEHANIFFLDEPVNVGCECGATDDSDWFC